ncbi:MAG: hypothetical protein J3Q66DRAFT_445279 [Benniella sp.]|nr:MAG: hypothetical protein J3Q66DRAFT_445279 [Benniella sp.]
MSGDGKRWFVFASQIGYAFDTQANLWNAFLKYSGELGYAAATDPATGRVFIPMFAISKDPMSAMISMFIVDSKDYTSRADNATSVMLRGWYKYAVTWNVVLKKLLMANMDVMYAYTPERGWKNFTGPPGLRGTDGLCMVSSSSGSKVVLFGGFSMTLNATVSDIFILDTATLTWKNGASGGPVRRDGACAMSGDYFIWGGATDTVDKVVPPMTIAYNLKTDKWTSNYITPNDNRTGTTPSGQGESHPTDTSSEDDTLSRTRSVGTIVGAVVGVLAIGMIIGGILLHRARKNRSKALFSSTNNVFLNNNSRKRTVHVGTAFVDGKALYIWGGFLAGSSTTQNFMIDLSVSWYTNNPVYKGLLNGPNCYICAGSMSADGQKVFTLMDDGRGFIFDTQRSLWTQIFTDVKGRGLGGATDPDTGKVFIPVMYDEEPDDVGRHMLIVDLHNNSTTVDSNPSMPEWSTYRIVWSALLKKILFVNEYSMHSYSLEEGWKNFTGPAGLKADQINCMVSSGSKVVLFGGYSVSPNGLMSDIFILDTATLTWKNGTSGRTIRRDAACAISGDYFIAWGADTTNLLENITPENVTMVYSLKTDQWTTTYIAPPVAAIPSTTPLTDTHTEPTEGGISDGSGHIGAIAGAVVGALVIGLITGGIVEYYNHKRRSKVSSSDVVTNSVDLDDDYSRKETVHVGTAISSTTPSMDTSSEDRTSGTWIIGAVVGADAIGLVTGRNGIIGRPRGRFPGAFASVQEAPTRLSALAIVGSQQITSIPLCLSQDDTDNIKDGEWTSDHIASAAILTSTIRG